MAAYSLAANLQVGGGFVKRNFAVLDWDNPPPSLVGLGREADQGWGERSGQMGAMITCVELLLVTQNCPPAGSGSVSN